MGSLMEYGNIMEYCIYILCICIYIYIYVSILYYEHLVFFSKLLRLVGLVEYFRLCVSSETSGTP